MTLHRYPCFLSLKSVSWIFAFCLSPTCLVLQVSFEVFLYSGVHAAFHK